MLPRAGFRDERVQRHRVALQALGFRGPAARPWNRTPRHRSSRGPRAAQHAPPRRSRRPCPPRPARRAPPHAPDRRGPASACCCSALNSPPIRSATSLTARSRASLAHPRARTGRHLAHPRVDRLLHAPDLTGRHPAALKLDHLTRRDQLAARARRHARVPAPRRPAQALPRAAPARRTSRAPPSTSPSTRSCHDASSAALHAARARRGLQSLDVARGRRAGWRRAAPTSPVARGGSAGSSPGGSRA